MCIYIYIYATLPRAANMLPLVHCATRAPCPPCPVPTCPSVPRQTQPRAIAAATAIGGSGNRNRSRNKVVAMSMPNASPPTSKTPLLQDSCKTIQQQNPESSVLFFRVESMMATESPKTAKQKNARILFCF